MPQVADHIYEKTRSALEDIGDGERQDIYVVSLFVYDEEDDPRHPTVTVGYHAEADVARATDPAEPLSTDEHEARWNYAFWRQNELVLICDSEVDPEGAKLRDDWGRAEGLWYDDPDDPKADDLDPALTKAFISLLERVVQRLHTGDITRIFGKTVPVLIHELEYYDEIAEQNLRANPPGAVPDGFVRWCRGE